MVRSFLIKDLLAPDDEEEDRRRHLTSTEEKRVIPYGSDPVLRQQEADPSLFRYFVLNREKISLSTEVPLPIYIRSDFKKFVNCSWPPRRRIRTVFTASQIGVLEKRFQTQQYLTAGERSEMARSLNLSALQVKTWFQNRRMKWKKTISHPSGSVKCN